LPWLVRHCAWTVTRYRTLQDGHTAFLRLTGAEYLGEIAPFGKVVMAKMPVGTKLNPAKLAPRWVRAVWLGRSSLSDEHMVSCETGVRSTRTVTRVVAANQWDEKMLKFCIGLPWNPQGYTREQIMEKFDLETREKKAAANTMVVIPPGSGATFVPKKPPHGWQPVRERKLRHPARRPQTRHSVRHRGR
jgi:hypothetical protein